MNRTIDYGIIDISITHYESCGYTRIEAPWLVTEDINNITKPDFASNYHVEHRGKKKTFVGSGEQSFLYMLAKGYLPDGKYQTVTPCIRDNQFDELHTKYFIKNELIIIDSNAEEDYLSRLLDEMMDDASEFFKKIVPHDKGIRFDKTDEGCDITYFGYELGSYGIRNSTLLGTWIYGTGVAEPRLSQLINCLETYEE